MQKKEIVKNLRASCSGSVLSSMIKLTEALIDECHEANEANRGEEFLITQGEIKALRRIQKYFKPKK